MWLALEVVPIDVRLVMTEIIDFIRINMLDPSKVFKSITNKVKMSGKGFGDHWRYFVNWELLGGYQDITHEEMVDEVRQFTSVPASSALHGKPVLDALKDLLTPLTGSVKSKRSLAEFLLDRDTWAKNTSGFVSTNIKRGRNKAEVAMNTTLSELVDIVYNGEFENRPFIKKEPGKARPVVNSNLPPYLLMSYVFEQIESTLKNNFGKNISIFDSASDKAKLWFQMVDDTQNRRGVFVPLDYSRFDSTISKDLAFTAFSLLLDMLGDLDPRLSKSAKDRFWRQRITTDMGSWEWNNAVLSGWRWTALITSLVNLSILRASGAFAVARGIVVQGDDVRAIFNSKKDAEEVIGNVNSYGFEINPSKVFCSAERDEYLRMVSSIDLRGYPIRSIPKILFVGPTETISERNEDKVNGMVSKWLTLISRGGREHTCKNLMIRDISGLTGWSRNDVKNWLNTPATVGGGGLSIGSDSDWMKMKLETEVIDDFGSYIMSSDYPRGLGDLWARSRNRKSRLLSGSLVKIQKIIPLGEWPTVDPKFEKGRPPRVRWIKAPLITAYKDQLIREKDWTRVEDLIENKTEVSFWKRVLPRFLYYDILRDGELDFNMPKTTVNAEVALTIKNVVVQYLFTKIKKYNGNISNEKVLRLKYSAELWARHILQGFTSYGK
nr:MAG: RNA dependent RNA polymerase [Seabass toti-like virus]